MTRRPPPPSLLLLLLFLSSLLATFCAVDGLLGPRPGGLSTHAPTTQRPGPCGIRPFVLCSATGSSDDESAETDTAKQPPVLRPRDDSPVELSVKRVLQKPSPEQIRERQVAVAKELAATSGGSANDSLEMLLQDAKLMQERQGDDGPSDEEGGIKAKVRDALSTIVTIDFFVVCGFLLWFLLGIFCSSVLRDDTVQIAFNSNFQAFVQPALGILMIAAVAGNFFKEDEEEPEY